MTEQDKITVDDIIGIVKTEEQTNSVEEVRKLRGRENKTAKRFTLDETFMITDNECMEIINPLMNSKDVAKVCELLNELHEKYIGEFSLRETLQLELQRVEEENKTLKTRFKEERELAMKLGGECDTLTIKKQELELEIIRLETIIRTGDLE